MKHGGKWCSWKDGPRRDLLLGSFVCTRYSTQRSDRHSKDYDPIQPPGEDKAVDTFFEVRAVIIRTTPRFFILENVDGVHRTRGKGKGTPLDFMLDDEVYGLRVMGECDYSVETVRDCRGTSVSLPQRRSRTLFFGVHKSEPTTASTVKGTFKAFLKISGKAAVHHFETFLTNHTLTPVSSDDGDDASDVDSVQEQIDYNLALKKAMADSVRCELWPKGMKLPPLASRPSREVIAPPGVRARIDVLSVILGEHNQDAGKHLVADVSQSMDRMPWRTDGTVPTLTTHSILFSFKLGKFIHPKDLALSMGIPASLNMNFLTVSQQRKIVGNGYIVPLAALACAAVCKATGHIVSKS